MTSLYDLNDKRMMEYEKFHKHPTNKLIHSIAIPQIIWTTAIFLSYIPFPIVTNMSYFVYAMFSTYYFNLNKTVGTDMTVFIGFNILFSKLFMLLFTNHIMLSFIVFIASWAAQFAGHFVWEKNSPALFTSLIDAFTVAPLFAFIELEKSYNLKRNVNGLVKASSLYINRLSKEFYDTSYVKYRVSEIEKLNKDPDYSSDNESISDETDGNSEREDNDKCIPEEDIHEEDIHEDEHAENIDEEGKKNV